MNEENEELKHKNEHLHLEIQDLIEDTQESKKKNNLLLKGRVINNFRENKFNSIINSLSKDDEKKIIIGFKIYDVLLNSKSIYQNRFSNISECHLLYYNKGQSTMR